MSRKYEEWVASLTVVGDEAFVPGEKAPRPYHRLTDEERATYNRDWMRRFRAKHRPARPIASLHSLKCTGPTRSTGCKCHKVVIYERVERAEMDRPTTRSETA